MTDILNKYDNVCHLMTLVKHDNMVKFRQDLQFQTRRLIIRALFRLGEGSSAKIHRYIINELKSEAEPDSYINERGLEVENHVGNYGEMSLRTVQRNIAYLCHQELVKKQGRLYSLADPLRANRFFGPKFGAKVLYSLIGPPDCELKTVKQNLDYLIRLFGTIVVFCCMEAARPKSNFQIPGDASNEDQLMSTISWINSVISPASLYHYFMFVFKNQIDDEMIPKLRKVTGKDNNYLPVPSFIDNKGNTYNAELYRDIPYVDEYLHMDRYSYVYSDYEPPLDEVKPQIYTRLVNALKELVPEMSSRLEELRADKDHSKDFVDDII